MWFSAIPGGAEVTNAPERIWLHWPAANRAYVAYDEPPSPDAPDGSTAFIRADLVYDEMEHAKMDHAAAFGAGVDYGQDMTLAKSMRLPDIVALIAAADDLCRHIDAVIPMADKPKSATIPCEKSSFGKMAGLIE